MALLKLKPAFSLTAVLVLPYGGKFQAGTNLRLKRCAAKPPNLQRRRRDCEFLCLCQANSLSWWVGYKTRKSELVTVIILKVWTVCVTKVSCTIRSDKMVTISPWSSGTAVSHLQNPGLDPNKERERGEGRGKMASFFLTLPLHMD